MVHYESVKSEMLDDINLEEYTIYTDDGFPLNLNVYSPLKKSDCIGLVNCATGVTQGYYERFSRYLASKGILSITWDYRGLGESMTLQMKSSSEPLKGFECTILTWAYKDLKAILEFIDTNFPVKDYPTLCVIGHSVGGQLPLLCPDIKRITRMLAVSVGSPYWRYMKKGYFIWMYSLFGRLSAYIKRYKAADFGIQALPKDAYSQWMEWCNYPDYMCHYKELRDMVSKFDKDILALATTDDDYMFEKGFTEWYKLHLSSNVKLFFWHPKIFGLSFIGHSGLFGIGGPYIKSSLPLIKDRIWSKLVPWITHGNLVFDEPPMDIHSNKSKL